MGDDTEWMKLSTEDKCSHKVWKARVAGYEEAGKLFQRLDDEKSPEFSKYAGLMKKFVTDNNAVAQEKALDAVLLFVENAHVAGRTAADVVNGVITKCLNASKTKTRDKGFEIIMMYIEIEKQDVVQEQLLAGLENKQPKVVVGCIQALTIALRDFGSKVIMIKPCLKVLPKLLEDRDKNVREETKQFIIELYRWIGAALKPQMTHFKPVQVQELEAEFEKLPSQKAVQVRFLRSQQDLKAKMEEQAAAGGSDAADGGDQGGEAEEIDPFDLIEAVDILSKLPKDFYEQIEAKKWQERKEALEAVAKLVESPKIENGDFGNLVRALLKVIAKDTNVMLVTIGGKTLASLAKGLRKKFQPYSNQCVSAILEKFKEKKAAVVAALRDAIDAAFVGTSLDQIMEDCVAALDNKNPSIRAETALFLSRCFAKSTVSTLPKKLLKAYCGSLLKTVNDTTPDVREASFQALGTAMKVVTEKNIAPFLTDVDQLKMQKIQECCQNAILLNAKGEPRGGGGAAPAAAAAPPKKNEPKPVQRPPAKPTAKVGSKPAGKPGGGAKKKAADKGKGKKGGAGKDEPTETILADEAVEEKAAAILPADVISGLASSNWKERMSAMETFSQNVKGMSKEEIPTQVFVRTLTRKPGLKETNFQVLKLKLELIGYLGKNSVFTKTTGDFCIPDIVDKVGDVKNGSFAQESLSCIAEATSLEYVSREVIKLAFEQKNPKNQSESMNWLSLAIKEFGFKVNIKAMIENIKKALAHTNPAVRGAAINLLGTVHMYMGAQLRMFFEDEKAALLQQIDAEFEKNKGQSPPAPTRGHVPQEEEEEEEKETDTGAEEINVQDLVPRNDISEKITEELLTELSDKNWKVRAEALRKVMAILNEAKFVTSNIGELASALKLRLGDANKILVTTTIGICQTLGTAMGPHCKHHIRTIGPGLIMCMADSKPQVRAATVQALNLWVDQCTVTPLVECEGIYDGLKTENPNLRAELLSWLTVKLPSHKILPPELKQCVPLVLACLEDRNGDVRKNAQEALVPFMIHTGYDSFFKATSKLKPASKDQVMKTIEAARANLPAKAPKAKKSAPAAAPPPAASSRFDEPEEPAKPAKAEKSESKSKVVKGKGAKAPVSSSKKKDDEETGPPMTLAVPKEQRFKDEKNMKVLKWNFLEVRGEYVEQLRTQMEKNFSKPMMDMLFHSDFKQHIKAIQVFIKCIETNVEETVGNLDLILKWLTLRFFDTNPSMLNKALEFLQQLFSMLADSDYHLSDLEATSFIPYLVLKVGEAKDNVRREVRKIFKIICKIYPASKMFLHLIDGLKSKNSKQRAECLDELGSLIESYGITICQPSPAHALKIIASQISDRDTSVRNAALNTVVVAHTILGEGIYKYIGNLAEKDQSLLEERIKRSAKNKPAPKQEERPKTAPLSQKTMSQPNIPRAMSAMQKSTSSNSFKREFVLDIDTEPTQSYVMPQLIQHDLDDMYEPLKLPNIKARPPSPSMTLMNSNDASAMIDFVISKVNTPDISTCIQALVQIDEVLKDEKRAEIMTSHVDQLVWSLSMQFKTVYSTHMGDEETSKDEVVRLYRCLLGTLLSVLQTPCLAKKAGKEILKGLINSLLTILLDSRLMDLEEGPQVVRSVNVTVIKIVERTDHSSMMSALIRLLQDCVSNESCSFKFIDLIMKCLWRMIRLLPEVINDLNIDRILMDCHLFLRAFPSNSWKDKESDMPLRTIKTVLHTLTKLKGHKILNHTGLIESSENSEMEAYLQKLLRNNVAATNAKNDELNENKMPKSASKSKRFSKSTHDMLAEIFKKIGSRDNTKEGLNDLYDFKKKYPDADLDPFLKKSSPFFQSYIEKGLNSIELERSEKGSTAENGSMQVSTSSSSLGSSMKSSTSSGGETGDPGYLLERLKALRVQCGLDNKEDPSAATDSTNTEQTTQGLPETESDAASEDDEKPFTSVNPDPPPPANPVPSVDVSNLKMRLDRIKKLANKS